MLSTRLTFTWQALIYEVEMNMPGAVVDNKVVHTGNLPGADPVCHSAREKNKTRGDLL